MPVRLSEDDGKEETMAIIGFKFTKMVSEKKAASQGEVNVQISLNIKDVSKADLKITDKKQGGLKYNFEFTATYTPDLGSIVLTGTIVDIQDLKSVQAAIKDWEKNKKLDDKKLLDVYNTALSRCCILAILLSKEMGLPSPIPLPRRK